MELSVLDSIVLAIAFSLNLFITSSAVAKGSNIRYTKGILQSIILAIFQCLFLFTGAWLSSLFNMGEITYDRTITSGVMIIMAIKIFVNIVKNHRTKDLITITNLKSMLFLSIATAMNTFIIGIALGFSYDTTQFSLTMILTLILGIVFSIIGIFFGRQKMKIPTRLILSIEAVLFIELAIKMYFQ